MLINKRNDKKDMHKDAPMWVVLKENNVLK